MIEDEQQLPPIAPYGATGPSGDSMEQEPKQLPTISTPGLAKPSTPKSPAALEAERLIAALKDYEAFNPAPPKLV